MVGILLEVNQEAMIQIYLIPLVTWVHAFPPISLFLNALKTDEAFYGMAMVSLEIILSYDDQMSNSHWNPINV